VKLIEGVDQLALDIATATRSQATGLQDINTTANEMSKATQQNAVAVEESNAATRALRTEIEELSRLIGQCDVGDAVVTVAAADQQAGGADGRRRLGAA